MKIMLVTVYNSEEDYGLVIYLSSILFIKNKNVFFVL